MNDLSGGWAAGQCQARPAGCTGAAGEMPGRGAALGGPGAGAQGALALELAGPARGGPSAPVFSALKGCCPRLTAGGAEPRGLRLCVCMYARVCTCVCWHEAHRSVIFRVGGHLAEGTGRSVPGGQPCPLPSLTCRGGFPPPRLPGCRGGCAPCRPFGSLTGVSCRPGAAPGDGQPGRPRALGGQAPARTGLFSPASVSPPVKRGSRLGLRETRGRGEV